ncbi:MAG: DUF3619 family protein [Betaproteobacteria bacterium]|nr:DUF3619 family protein [Betaproteobacteria bacterium]
MIRDQDEFAKKLRGYLDAGAADLRAGTVYRLQQARAAALARMAEPARVPQPQLAHALAGGGATGGGTRRMRWLWVGILLIAAGVFGWQQWHVHQQTRELEELDAQILSSDLPIDAYLDRGFQTWLTRYQP